MSSWGEFASFEADIRCSGIDELVDQLVMVCNSMHSMGIKSTIQSSVCEAIGGLMKDAGYRECKYVNLTTGSVCPLYSNAPSKYKHGDTCYIVLEDEVTPGFYKLYKANVLKFDHLTKKVRAGFAEMTFKKWYVNVEYFVDGFRWERQIDVVPGNVFRSIDYAREYYGKKGVSLNKCN